MSWARRFVMVSMSSAGMYSKRPWKFSPPVHRFGQGRPSKDRRAPSVPPRMGTIFGVTPTDSIAFFAFSIRNIHGAIFSFML